MIPFGIMQGRLLPPFEGRFQTFPAAEWQREFHLAKEAGISCIEWIYEVPHKDDNPLVDDRGLDEIRRVSRQTGVGVWSICADYFMQRPLIGAHGQADAENVGHLDWLIGQAGKLGITYVVLPFVDASSLGSAPAKHSLLAQILGTFSERCAQCRVELHLETDLPPVAFSSLMRAIDNPFCKVNFDIGNSASLGYDPAEELGVLGQWLGSVHVKDRLRNGGTVPLGTGNADLGEAFRQIARCGFDRWFILQVARGQPEDELNWIREALGNAEALASLAGFSR